MNARLAILRDGGQCAVHWFRDGQRVPYDEVHHVYGRGKEAGSFREHFTAFLCVCKQCHAQLPPIQTPGGDHTFTWVEELLGKANAHPINPEFKAPD